ncbi:MAG: tRNA (N(6)-L-threonylcarbamoyladenosine(37)-C(2))-methylthiotransferase MtaB [Lentisphaerae bacterium GWF2_52_8]|nr:MAG: tRNA (N(6)-L-threonylcarbamoyladenosine(37)-C(2))-methylthiotransferase MtaB [Lentisphaerae bacterium GWF2_52_8]
MDGAGKTYKSAAVFTHGCRLNQADTALIYDRLDKGGYTILPLSAPKIDVIIVNSCAVTGVALRKSRETLRKFRRQHPESLIALTGCAADLSGGEFKGASRPDLLISNEGKKDIVRLIGAFQSGIAREFKPQRRAGELFKEDAQGKFPFKSRAFLKVQEGCEAFCSYCIVPYARGPERSRDWDEIIADFRQMLAAGYKEIVLSGVNICAYRCAGRRLPDLLDILALEPGEFRLRLSSTEPHPSNRELLKVMAAHPEKICRFLHLPLQHGADEILKAMGRSYGSEEYASFLVEARRLIPDIHLGSDIIVGFPSESDELFMKSFKFVESMSFSNLHIFTFSPRPGTPAAGFPGKVPLSLAKERYELLLELSVRKAREFAEAQIGKRLTVLAERRLNGGGFEGWSDNYLNVQIPCPGLSRNQFANVLIKSIDAEGRLLANKTLS